MRLLHTAAKTRATFDDPNLVSHAGLVPAVRLAENVGLEELVAEHVHVAAKVGADPDLKLGSLVAGMIAGADTIEDGPAATLRDPGHGRCDPRPVDAGVVSARVRRLAQRVRRHPPRTTGPGRLTLTQCHLA